jgi:hypothetical protein
MAPRKRATGREGNSRAVTVKKEQELMEETGMTCRTNPPWGLAESRGFPVATDMRTAE